jgi:hypothetical protein
MRKWKRVVGWSVVSQDESYGECAEMTWLDGESEHAGRNMNLFQQFVVPIFLFKIT